MKQTIIGLVIGVVIGAGAMWAFGSRSSGNSSPKMSRILDAADSTLGNGNGGGPRYSELSAFDSTLGNGNSGGPRFTTPGLPAGSTLIITCIDKNCGSNSGGAGTGPSPAIANVLFELRIPNDVPANTAMLMSYRLAPKKVQASK